MSRSAKTTVTLAGAAATVAGLAMVSAGPDAVDSDGNGVNEWSLNDDYSMPLLGSMLVVAGLATVLGGLTASTPEESPAFAPAPPPTPFTTERPRTSVLPALPEVAVDEDTLRLARTTRTVAMAGNCDAARVLLDKIAARSDGYYRALVAGPVLDSCSHLRPTTPFGDVR